MKKIVASVRILLIFAILFLLSTGFDGYVLSVEDIPNNAPVLTPAGPDLPAINEDNEDDISNPGILVSDIVGDSISDVDAGALEGIAVYLTDNGNGRWEYAIGANPRWYQVGSVSTSEALLLRSEDKVRFHPNGENGTAAGFHYYAWDRTSGTVGSLADVNVRGGSTSFSVDNDTASIIVDAVNDVPVLRSGFENSFITVWPRSYNHYGNNINQYDPRLASNGSSFLAVWYEQYRISQYSYEDNVYIARFADDGTVLDQEGVKLGSSGTFHWDPEDQYPAVCPVDEDYWVFTGKHNTVEYINATVVAPDGTIQSPFEVGRDDGLSSIEKFNCAHMQSNNVIIVWHDFDPSGLMYSLVSPEKVVLVNSQRLASTIMGSAHDVKVAASPSAFLVAYYDAPGTHFSGIRIDANGGVIDEVPILIDGSYPAAIDIIPYDDGWLAVYDTGQLRGRIIYADGRVSDELFSIPYEKRTVNRYIRLKITATDFGFLIAWSWGMDGGTQYSAVYTLDHDFNLVSHDKPDNRNIGYQLAIARNVSGNTLALWGQARCFGMWSESYCYKKLKAGLFDEDWITGHLPDHGIDIDETLSHTFPADTFYDVDDGDTLTYLSSLADDTALPLWLGFSPVTRTYSGTPGIDDGGSLSVKVTAIDSSTDSFSGGFNIYIDDSDRDGVPEGDGTNLCAGGVTEDCDDNCVDVPNPDQADYDGDGVGDVCDICWKIFPDETPIIDDVDKTCVSELGRSDLIASANDPCGGGVTYTWTPLNGGTIMGSGGAVQFDPPDTGPHPCPYQVELTVTSDISGLQTTQVINVYIKNAGDADGNGVVNLVDKLLVRQHYGELEEDDNWDARADVTCDGVVNLMDKLKVRQQYGLTDGCVCQ